MLAVHKARALQGRVVGKRIDVLAPAWSLGLSCDPGRASGLKPATCAPPLRAQGGADELAVAGADGMLRLHGAGGEAAGPPQALGLRPAALCFPARGAPPPRPALETRMPGQCVFLVAPALHSLRVCTSYAVSGLRNHMRRHPAAPLGERAQALEAQLITRCVIEALLHNHALAARQAPA